MSENDITHGLFQYIEIIIKIELHYIKLILFFIDIFENYSIENSKCGEKDSNFHQFIKRSKKSNICKIRMIRQILFLHCIEYSETC